MKTNFLTITTLLAGLFALASCSNNEEILNSEPTVEAGDLTEMQVNATINEPETRLHAAESGGNLVMTWNDPATETKEIIYVYKGENSTSPATFKQTTISDDGHKADFEGKILADMTATYYAFYASDAPTTSPKEIMLSLGDQEGTGVDVTKVYMYAEKQIEKDANGKKRLDFEFTHLASVLKLDLFFEDDLFVSGGTKTRFATGDKIKNVTFTSDEGLITSASVDITNSPVNETSLEVTYNEGSETRNPIKLTGEFDVQFEENTDIPYITVYLEALPQTINNLIITAEDESGKIYSYVVAGEKKLLAGKMHYNMADAEAEPYIMVEGLTAGSLASLDLSSYTNLKVVGDLTEDDIAAIAEWAESDGIIVLDLSEANFPENTITEQQALCSGNYTELILPNGLKVIDSYGLCDCYNLETVSIPNTVETIKDAAFECCNALTEITIPSSVKELGTSDGAGVFESCQNLQKVTILGGPYIGRCTFDDCPSLQEVYILGETETIDQGAFSACPKLTDLYIGANKAPTLVLGNTESYRWDSFDETVSVTVHVPIGAATSYNNDENWKSLIDENKVVIEEDYN